MSQTNFQKLDVYKLAEKLADEIWNIVIKWDALAKDTVGKQIIRSADKLLRPLNCMSKKIKVLWGVGV
ncbi:hypothetical protein QUB75_27355 [Microcoleus sp. K1-B6]|uniref:four helix bundle protein n=1 Tax=unclassified Microcoleus TaxID=2642155 RepID=UPI002FD4EF4B